MAPAFLLLPTLARTYEGLKAQPPEQHPLAKGAFDLHNHFLESFDRASPAHLLLASQYANFLNATTSGVEVAAHWSPIARWRLDAGYSTFHLTPHLSAKLNRVGG